MPQKLATAHALDAGTEPAGYEAAQDGGRNDYDDYSPNRKFFHDVVMWTERMECLPAFRYWRSVQRSR